MTDNSTILYDHYKDTNDIVGKAIKRRDRLMLYMVILLGFFGFQSIYPNISSSVIKDLLDFKFGIGLNPEPSIIGSVMWSLLMIFVLRYSQVSVFIERQYCYIHTIEDKINQKLGEDLVTREGKTYLYKYPLLSNWTWGLYTIIFPILLFVICSLKIMKEITFSYAKHDWSFSLILDSVIFLLLSITLVLYLINLHKK